MVRPMFWLLIPLACDSARSQIHSASALSPDRHEVQAVVSTPKSVSQVPSSELAHAARAHCPKVLWTDFKPDQAPFGTLSLHSDRPFSELQVAMPQGRSATATGRPSEHPAAPKGTQDFAIGCRDCTLVLAFEHQGEPIACEGPGMAVVLAAGSLIPWQES
ncbi:MAG: hypothetical protein ACI9VR_002120 [Cognaticolwellia sp.]|jgi:hypothetical protein